MSKMGRFGTSIAKIDGNCFWCKKPMPKDMQIFFDNHVKKYVCKGCAQDMAMKERGEPSSSEPVAAQPPLRNNELEALKARVASLEAQMARAMEHIRKVTVDGKVVKDIFDGFT